MSNNFRKIQTFSEAVLVMINGGKVRVESWPSKKLFVTHESDGFKIYMKRNINNSHVVRAEEYVFPCRNQDNWVVIEEPKESLLTNEIKIRIAQFKESLDDLVSISNQKRKPSDDLNSYWSVKCHSYGNVLDLFKSTFYDLI